MPPAAVPGRFNHVLNHVAISVPDLDAGMKFYSEILGFRQIRSSVETIREKMPEAAIFKIYGDSLSHCRVGWMAAGNGVGIELFEFKDPAYSGHPDKNGPGPSGFNYPRGGVFHIAITHPDPDTLCDEMVKAGGTKLGETVTMSDGDKALYCQDPWGTVIEVLSCSMETLMANRG